MNIKMTSMGHPWDIHGLVRTLGFYRAAFAWGVVSTVVRFLAQMFQMPNLFIFFLLALADIDFPPVSYSRRLEAQNIPKCKSR